MRAHFIDRSRSFSCSPSNLTLEPAEPAERHIYANFVFLDFGVFSVHFAALPSTLSALEMKNFRYYCIELWNSNQFITHLLCEFSVVSTYIWIKFLFFLLLSTFAFDLWCACWLHFIWAGSDVAGWKSNNRRASLKLSKCSKGKTRLSPLWTCQNENESVLRCSLVI